MDYLHLINNGRNYYVYIPATYNIVRTNKLAYTAIQMLQTGSSIDSVCKTCNLSQSEIKRMELFLRICLMRHFRLLFRFLKTLRMA